MIRSLLIIATGLFSLKGSCADTLQVSSPSGQLKVKLWIDKGVYYQIRMGDDELIRTSRIDFIPENQVALSSAPAVRSSSIQKVNTEIIAPVPEKRRVIHDHYNQLTVNFKRPYKIEFRVYDDGAAYRILTAFKDSLIVKNEIAEINLPQDAHVYFPDLTLYPSRDSFQTSFEHRYAYQRIDTVATSRITYSPVLVDLGEKSKIAITESDLEEYPGMFFTRTEPTFFKGIFSRYPLEEQLVKGEPDQWVVTKKADYIARTRGTRSFPWRVFIVAKEDKELPSNDLVYRLASPSRITDVSWVKPGNITDEWIIDVNLFNVPFRAGRNTASYKYYIDFAQRFGFDRVMFDAGWSDYNDIFALNSEMDMDSLFDYARSKNVKIALWTSAVALERQLDSALKQFKKWGVDFIMTDFIDRDDQKAVDFHHRIARVCADHQIMIMFHGSFPPKGFNRTYPNAVAREGVLGSEYNIWTRDASPDHDVLLPFIRMVAGSFDYEPGLMINATQKSYSAGGRFVMSQGTRCHQLSMYIVYDNPMQFFAGNPSQGMLEPEYMQLLGSLPTIWDETIILDAKLGQYIITARRKGNDWYIGGMTDWTARDLEIALDFLDAGPYKGTICKDGPNADRYASDYTIEHRIVTRNDRLKLHLAPGGGFLVKVVRE